MPNLKSHTILFLSENAQLQAAVLLQVSSDVLHVGPFLGSLRPTVLLDHPGQFSRHVDREFRDLAVYDLE